MPERRFGLGDLGQRCRADVRGHYTGMQLGEWIFLQHDPIDVVAGIAAAVRLQL